MTTVSDAATWMKNERARLGWSAADLAARARQLAETDGFDAKLRQQSISAFENGTAKRMPVWFRYVERAISDARSNWREEGEEAKPLSLVTMQVAMPNEDALTAMFQALLRILPDDATEAERARILARRLPSALGQLRDLA